jgi:hypothetical protein
VIRWLEAQEKVNGSLKIIAIADHIPGQVSKKHFEELWLPYTAVQTVANPTGTESGDPT